MSRSRITPPASIYVSPLALSLCAALTLLVSTGAVPVWAQALDGESDPSLVDTLTLVADPEAIPAGGAYATLLTATLTDADGQPVADCTVVFQTTAGHLTRGSARSNQEGQAETFLRSAPEPTIATVTARCGRLWAQVKVIMYSGDAGEGSRDDPPPTAELKIKWDGGSGCAPPDEVVADLVWVKLNVVYDSTVWPQIRHDWTTVKENVLHPNQTYSWSSLPGKTPQQAEPG